MKWYLGVILFVCFFTQKIKAQEFISDYYFKALIDLKYKTITQKNYTISGVSEINEESYIHTFRRKKSTEKTMIIRLNKKEIKEDFLLRQREQFYRDTLVVQQYGFIDCTQYYDGSGNMYCEVTSFSTPETGKCMDTVNRYFDARNNVYKEIRRLNPFSERRENGVTYKVGSIITDFSYNAKGQLAEEIESYFATNKEFLGKFKTIYTYYENGLPKTVSYLTINDNNIWIVYYKNEFIYT